MDDLSNPQSLAGVATEGTSPVSPPAIEVGGRPTRQIDRESWLSACRNCHPWSPLARIAAGKTLPLLWGLTEIAGSERERLIQFQRATQSPAWKKELTPSLERWLDDAEDIYQPTAALALEAVAWAYLLPLLARERNGERANRLLAQLLALIDQPLAGETADQICLQLWLKIELPLILACFADDTRTANSLRKGAIGAEARLAAAGLDALGFPKQERAKLLRPWLAAMLRSQELLRGSEVEFSETARDRLERLARNVLRLTRPEGSSILHSAAGTANDREFLTAAVLVYPNLQPLAAMALGKGTAQPKPGFLPLKGQPAAAQYSASSSLAILRTRWAAPAVQATVDFSGSQAWLDLTCGQQPLLQGHWTATVQVDGQERTPLGPWSEVCWHSDADCDYLEIEQKLSGGWLLQRHLLLVRRDECLLLADSLLNEQKLPPEEFLATAANAPRLEYRTNLPFAPGVCFAWQQETREGELLAGKKTLGLVLPLALPEWRKQPCPGDLTANADSLTYSLRTPGRNLFAPLWIDLNPARFKRAEATWRQLTVGEALAIQPREVAVGYRVQVHYSQWLLYRSLAWRGNRTVLGKNFATDFACCRFHPNGETDEILEVQ